MQQDGLFLSTHCCETLTQKLSDPDLYGFLLHKAKTAHPQAVTKPLGCANGLHGEIAEFCEYGHLNLDMAK